MSITTRILRFNVRVGDEAITLPAGKVTRVAESRQFGPSGAEIWILCTTRDWPNNDAEGKQTFFIVGTGHEVPPNTDHVASWAAEPFQWHLFRQIECECRVNGMLANYGNCRLHNPNL